MKKLTKTALAVIAGLALTAFATTKNAPLHVSTNAELISLSTVATKTVIRDGFTVAGDAPPLMYEASTVACTLNSGDGDNGSQVKSQDGKCWLAQFDYPLDPRLWGKSYPIQMYVATTGSDNSGTNFCLDVTKPCLTPSRAATAASQFNVQGLNATVNLAAGTYADSPFCTGALVGGVRGDVNQSSLVFQGPDAIGSAVIAGDGAHVWSVGVSNGCAVGILNVKLTATAVAGQAALYAQNMGIANVYQGNIFGAANGQHIITEGAGSQVQFWNSFTISGGATYFALSNTAQIELNPCVCVITLTGTPAFSTAFAGAAYNGYFTIQPGWTFSGSATGSQFRAVNNGVIWNASGSTLPGSTIGTKVRGGAYDPPIAPTTSGVTGLGTGGTATVDAGSGASSGWVTLNTGSASTASTGSVTLTFFTEIEGTTAKPGPCIFTPYPSGSGWSTGASAMGNGFGSNTVTFNWTNGSPSAFALALSSTYKVSYICRASS